MLQYLLQRPTGEQTVTQGATERVTSAKTIQWPDGYRWRLDPLASSLGQHPLRALLHNRQFHPSLEERICGLLRLGFANRYLTLLTVTNRHRDMGQRSLHLLGRMRRGVPKHRTVIKIKNDVLLASPCFEDGEVGFAAWLLAQAGDRQPHQSSG